MHFFNEEDKNNFIYLFLYLFSLLFVIVISSTRSNDFLVFRKLISKPIPYFLIVKDIFKQKFFFYFAKLKKLTTFQVTCYRI